MCHSCRTFIVSTILLVVIVSNYLACGNFVSSLPTKDGSGDSSSSSNNGKPSDEVWPVKLESSSEIDLKVVEADGLLPRQNQAEWTTASKAFPASAVVTPKLLLEEEEEEETKSLETGDNETINLDDENSNDDDKQDNRNLSIRNAASANFSIIITLISLLPSTFSR